MINSLYISKTGLSTAKYSVDVTSNNIANENSEGYVKRTVNTSEINLTGSQIGNGVSFDSVTRSTNSYLYDKLVSQSSLSSYYEKENSILSNIEIMFNEIGSTGFSTTLSNFFDSIELLKGDSTNIIYQNKLSTQSQLIVDSLQSLNNNLNDSLNSLDAQLEKEVDIVNNLLKQIVYVNEQMQNTGERDALEKELSSYVNVEVNRNSSTYNLQISGVNVIFNNTNLHEISVKENNIAQKDIYNSSDLADSNFNDGDEITITLDGTTTLTLNASVSGTDDNELKQQIIDAINSNSNFSNYTAYLDSSKNLVIKSNIEGEDGAFDISISVNDTEISKNANSIEASNSISLAVYNNSLSLTGGSLKAITQELTTSTSNIYSYKQSLDDFAKALVDYSSENSSVSLFFGTDVNSLTFNNNVTSLTSADLENLAKLQWSENLTIGSSTNTSFSEFYQNLLVTISSNVENNSFKLDSQKAIVNSLETTYNNLTKVDSDEEMINLLKYQAAYEANAKIITAIDEMLQTLLAM